MQKELQETLKVINFDYKYHSLLEDAQITSADFDLKDGITDIHVKIKTILDVRIYELLVKAAEESGYNFRFVFKLDTPANDIAVNTYYSYFMNKKYSKMNFADNLKRLTIELRNGRMVFAVSSETLKMSLESIRRQLQADFKAVGITYPIEIEINKIDDIEVQKLIEEDERKVSAAGSFERVLGTEESKPDPVFIKKGYEKLNICDITNEDNKVETMGRIFAIDTFKTRRGDMIYTFFITDEKDSIMFKLKESAKISKDFIKSLHVNDYVSIKGGMKYDDYARDTIFEVKDIEKVIIDDKRYDNADEKRVELHLHTNMSAMDGIPSAEAYVKQALEWGHKAIAITDHGDIQNFPDIQRAAKGKPIKIIYGMEGYVVDDTLTPAINPQYIDLEHATYVIFDLETTGLSTHYDSIIEFGAVKIQNGLEIDHLQMFINPLRKLDPFIVKTTKITDDMLVSAPVISEALTKIMDFIGEDSILVAHNATFDYGFINQALADNYMEPLKNPVIDTLPLARCLFPNLNRFSLGRVARHLNVTYDEETAHRADYDAQILASVYEGMLSKCLEKGMLRHSDLNNFTPADTYKSAHPYHMTFLVKNAVGLKNLYQLVTMSNIEYMASLPLIPKRRIAEYREGLLVGSACFNGEVFEVAQTRSYEELKKCIDFFDYIEIQPLENYRWLIDTGKVPDKERLINVLKDIVKAGMEMNKIVVATGDCHYINPRDKIFRDVYIIAKAVGMKRHPLYDFSQRVKENPNQHFRTTNEMIEGISFLDDPKLERDLVIKNTNLIADMIEEVEPIKDKLFTPELPNIDAQKEIEKLCHERVKELYGDNPPQIVTDRMNMELDKIGSNGYGVIYYLAYRLIKKSNSDGYLVGSRGSVGSSLVASLCGISEVDPMPPHYLCPNCHHVEFFDESVKSGFDLEDKACPECGTLMNANGQNIPFETFLGIKGDKVPDIDLNFATEYQAQAHNYTKVLLGENNVFRAGTISTVATKTARGYAKDYFETIGRPIYRESEIRRLSEGCTGVKKTTGQHPAGIIVVPLGMDVHDFTPVQYPAEEVDASWKTTHYKFKDIHDEILKLDILGHVDPSAIRMLQDLTGINPEDIPMNDPKVLSLFTSVSELKVSSLDVLNNIGSAGIPEFGTSFVKGVLADAKPKKFSELVQISGLTHGTDVWNGNAQELIRKGTCSLMDVVGCRDDIMTYLVNRGLDRKKAFDIMEKVRKGKGLSKEMEDDMIAHDVPKWYIDSCKKIAYMFPKAHAVAYVIMALRIAWFKIYYPLEYYATYFSLRCDAYDIKTMIEGKEAIRDRLTRIKNMIKEKDRALTTKDESLEEVLEVALEMTTRGYSFANLSLTHSQAKNFIVDKEHDALIPPLMVLDGLGMAAAESFVVAREKSPFISKEDMMKRTQINSTQLKMLEQLKVLDELEEENQMQFKLF